MKAISVAEIYQCTLVWKRVRKQSTHSPSRAPGSGSARTGWGTWAQKEMQLWGKKTHREHHRLLCYSPARISWPQTKPTQTTWTEPLLSHSLSALEQKYKAGYGERMNTHREDLLMESVLAGSLATVDRESVDWEYTLLSLEPRKSLQH